MDFCSLQNASVPSQEPAIRKFDGKRDGIASAEAEGGDAALEIAALQFVEQRDQDAGAGCADGMAERDGAAIDVYFFGIEPQHAGYGDGCDRESFVQFVE